jgi:hypothetical protein
MLSSLLSGAIILAYLFVPGYLILIFIGEVRHRLMLAYAVSLSLLVLSSAILLLLPKSAPSALGLIHLTLSVSAVVVIRLLQNPKQDGKICCRPSREEERVGIFACLFIVVTYVIYHVIMGSYTEIPADFWKHLARVQIEHSLISDTRTNSISVLEYLTSGSKIVYLLYALLASSLNTSPIDLVPTITAINSVVFIINIYWFSVFLYRKFFGHSRYIFLTSVLAVIFTLASFGTATFGYVRYYAYFPTILALPLVYISIVIFSEFLENPKSSSYRLWLISISMLTAAVLHHQEAMFILIILGGIAFVARARAHARGSCTGAPYSATIQKRVYLSSSFFLGVFAIIVIYAFSTQQLAEWRHTPHLIDAGRYVRLLSDIPIDNPSFRLWDTVGLFGLIVYVWSLLRWRVILRSNYLIAGLLIPFFTNLNPIYTTVFLHFGAPTGLWRTAFLIPFPFVAALLTGITFQDMFRKINPWQKLTKAVPIVLLVLSLLPWTFQGYYNRTSRIPSFLAVEHESGAELFHDLITKVAQIQQEQEIRRIITDSVTRFVLYAATRGEIWWWTEGDYFPKHNSDYQQDFLESDFSHSLLVVNERNGQETQSARHAGHWPVGILEVSKFYPKDLQDFVDSHPALFQLLWKSEDVRIYLMHPKVN